MIFYQDQAIMIVKSKKKKIILLKTYFMDKKKGLSMIRIQMKYYKIE